jgi:hypothetical protein
MKTIAISFLYSLFTVFVACGYGMVAACVLPPAPTPERPLLLSAPAFARAESFINQSARPLERALMTYYFHHGSRDAVLVDLAKFQNSDGGFAANLESDNRWTGSSPMGTMIALRIFNKMDAPVDNQGVQRAIRYLLATFDDKNGCWRTLSKDSNAAPHAPWWEVNPETGKTEVDSQVFPTAHLAGYLRRYSALLPAGFLDRITNSSLAFLSAAPLKMQMPDVEATTEMSRFLPLDQKTVAVKKLREVLSTIVVRDPQQWATYGVQPLSFIKSPESPYYLEMEEAVAANLDYVIEKQQADGGWEPNWSWEEKNAAAWAIAKKEWRGELTLENLEKLDAFHRIAH